MRKSGVKWEKEAKGATDNIFGSFEGMVKKVVSTISAAAIGKMLLNIGKDAIQAASDLQEVQNVVDVTFGDAGAKKIEAWAKSAGSQFGLTETQAKRFTSTLGAMMKSAGLTGDEIVDMSTDMAGLAADMASFYNLDFDTAFQKIRSGISGETEPLKQLGINMSVANLNAFALQKGLEKTFDQMTQGEQTMLRYQYLMSATADAQGDFARTSDGFANATRMLQTNIDSLKTKLGEVLLPVVNEVISGVNEMLGALTGSLHHTVIDDFNDIDTNAATKTAEIEKTADQARALIGVLEELKIEEFEGAGDAADGNERWLETCRRLVETLPGLNSIINTETGEINGGIEAVYDYVDAWEEAQKKLIAMNALEEKRQALANKRVELVDYEVSARADRIAQENWEAQHPDIAANVQKYGSLWLRDNAPGDVAREYADLITAANNSSKAFDEQSQAVADAEEKLKLYEQAVEEMPGDIEMVTEAENEMTAATAEVATEAEKAFNEALDAVNEYRQAVQKATREQVDNSIGGFTKMKTAAQQAEDAANAYQEFADSLKDADLSARELEIKLDAANKQITAQSMTQALKSQVAFIEEYKKNLEDVKNTGLIDENIIAQLSDGSQESAQYLHAMAEAARSGDTKALTDLNDAWKAVNEGKDSFVDTLTQQKLAVDDTYDSMVAKAQEAAKNLDVSEMAGESTGNNIQAMADAITGKLPEVVSAVNAVLAELNRLNDWGVTIDYGFGGSTVIKPGARASGGGAQIASLAVGADWIPFDGFLAQLHQGEAVLTAEENRVWQAFKNGQRGVDYDQIGGMISGIKPGGDVYLEGRVVGQVVSQIQGNQYRSMQRSGWQG